MHNGDRDGFPERSGFNLWICGHWIMPMLWSGGRTDKISNKLAGDVACLGGSMVEHQPRSLGSRVRFPAGVFAIFSVSAKASLPNSLSPFPFLFLSLPLSFPSSSFPFLFLSIRPFVCARNRGSSRLNKSEEACPSYEMPSVGRRPVVRQSWRGAW